MKFSPCTTAVHLLLFAAMLPARPATAQTSADDVLQRMDELQHRTKNESAKIEMRLFEGDHEVRRRDLTLLSSTDSAGRTSALVEFTQPPDIRGMSLLTIQTDHGDDQRIYLPALRRIQRIAGSAREDRFAGSDLSYEDLRIRDRNDYISSIIDSTASEWTIQSIPKDKSSPYSRIVATIGKNRYVLNGARYFDRKNKLWKILTASNFQDVGGGVWKATKVTMEDVRADRRTELTYLERDLQTRISPDVFTDRYLRRGVQ